MAVPAGIKIDDGTNTSFVSKCFPARRVFGQANDGGAWLVAQQAEQKRHFQAVLNVKQTKTYAQIKAERRQKEKAEAVKNAEAAAAKEGQGRQPPPGSAGTGVVEGSVTEGLLDGFFMLKHCCVEDPSDVCSINIAGQDLTDVKEEDFTLFDNVAYVNAGENLLPFEAFRNFPIVRELELPLNGLRSLRIELDDYPQLEVLDLSYNNLSKEDVLTLGLLPKLKVLYLTGNQLHSIPTDIAKPFRVDTGEGEPVRFPRFGNLEILFLDDNQLTDLATFASLAGLKKLKRLNLDKNEIQSIPHLKALSGHSHIAIHSDPPSEASTPGRKEKKKRRKSGGSRSSSRASSRGSSRASTPGKPTDEATDEQREAPEPSAAAPGAEASAADSTATATVTAAESEPSVAPVESVSSIPSEAIEMEAKLSALQAALATESGSTFSSTYTGELPPPFPELEYLSLAYNKISEEEGLLALAVWPMLKELVIHNNPLTMNNSGDPPLLKRYLQDRLGIQMVRRKQEQVKKPIIQVPSKPHRKVKELPRPLPKRPLDLLMLEGVPETPALPSSSHQPHPPAPRPSSQPLPPIPTSDDQTQQVDPANGVSDEKLYEEKMTRAQSWTEENFAKARSKEKDPKMTTTTKAPPVQQADEPVFLTQVDDQGDEEVEEDKEPPPPEKETKAKRNKKGRIDSAAYSMAVPQKYKGYEVFYDAQDDPEIPVQDDIQGNLRALRLTLKHSTNYRDNRVDLETLQKPFQPYQKAKIPPRPPHQSKAEKLEDILTQMKDRMTTEEVNLAKILEDKTRLKEEFPEVNKLLKEFLDLHPKIKVRAVEQEQVGITDDKGGEINDNEEDGKGNNGVDILQRVGMADTEESEGNQDISVLIQDKYKEVRNASVKNTQVQKQSVEDALKSLHNLGDKLKPSTAKVTATR